MQNLDIQTSGKAGTQAGANEAGAQAAEAKFSQENRSAESDVGFFKTSDGAELYYRYKLEPNLAAMRAAGQNLTGEPNEPKAVVIFHRGHEHSGRVEFMFDELNLEGFSYFAWDQRGHGKSPGERGDAPSIGRLVADVDEFVEFISQHYGIKKQNIAVIAQSVGAVLVSAWLHDYAPKIRCAVLASPAFKVKLYVPFARVGLSAAYKFNGNFFVNSYVKAHYLTHNEERIASYNADTLIARAISVRILLGLYEAADRVVTDAAAITTPVQLLISGDDWVVSRAPQHKFYNNLGSHIKERHVLEGFYHDTLGEKEREKAFSHIRRFVRQRFAEPFKQVDCKDADKFGFSRKEADELATPLCKFHYKNLCFGIQRFGMKALSPWVTGLKIGENTGYDSGSTLDYVYQNKPQGENKFFRFIDKIYLNAIGWRGIRTRKQNIKLALDYAIARLREKNQGVRLIDIASGHGRYILDALENQEGIEQISLRDYSKINVEAGREMIEKRNLSRIATFDEANAFSAQSYADIKGAYTLGVVSGLFELFADNDLVRTALDGFASSVQEGGYLIYTNQPWHPQLEMIARALSSHRQGAAWVMRRRSQAEMDQLVENAGFKKLKEWIDDDGIFSVSVAVRG